VRYRRLVNNDFSFGNGNADFLADSPECVAQAVETRLELFKGEWFLNFESGTPYFQEIFASGGVEIAPLVLQQRILQTVGVTDILDFSFSFNNVTRQAEFQAEINTEFGAAIINGNQ
jgi:hypothetical protein